MYKKKKKTSFFLVYVQQRKANVAFEIIKQYKALCFDSV